MPAPEILPGVRVVASPSSLAAAAWPDGMPVLPLADDEVLVLGEASVEVADPEALILPEEGFCGVTMEREVLEAWMEREAEWPLPTTRAYFAQGMAAGLPVKVWVDGGQALLVTRASLSRDLEDRL